MPYFLGIDGGGTKTACVVGDESQELGRGIGAGSNLHRNSEADVLSAMSDAVQQACSQAGITTAQIEAACVGAAGGAGTRNFAPLRRILLNLLPGCRPERLRVVGDHDIALHAAFGDGPGVIVIAGTGSIVLARDARGNTARAGGWGFAVSDEGSGYWIGHTAVRAALREIDRGRPRTLLDLILAEWNLADVDALVQEANRTPPPNFAVLFPVVAFAAESGEPLAVSLLRRAAGELVQLANIAMRRLWPADAKNGDGTADVIRIATVGSVFAHSAEVRTTFVRSLRVLNPAAQVSAQPVDPALGALVLARRIVGDEAV